MEGIKNTETIAKKDDYDNAAHGMLFCISGSAYGK